MRCRFLHFLVVTFLLGASSALAAEFKHPAGAYTLPVPDGWKVQAFLDPLGYPVHFFGPEEAKGEGMTGAGLRIHASAKAGVLTNL